MKELKYDVEIIIDYEKDAFFKYIPSISTHRMFRGLTLGQLYKLLKENNYYENCKVVINIRGC